MPTTDDHGFPVYTDSEAMPDWDVFANTLGTALGEQLDEAAQDAKDDDTVATIAGLPVSGNWTGRLIYVVESDLVYLWDGTGWYAISGKLPYFFGSRADSAVGTGASAQAYITTSDYARGVTFSSGVLTFATVGIYRVDQSAIWEANGSGQRNLGIEGTGITILGPAEHDSTPSATVEESQSLTTYIQVNSPGATATPYVTHNTGIALDVQGTVCVMWVSA